MASPQTKRVLIILYYWPPSGGGGVQRWLKFAKYLPFNGWEPIVFAPADADYPIIDETLEQEVPPDLTVIKHPIWEPYRAYQKFTGNEKGANVNEVLAGGSGKQSLKERAAVWVRGNLFIPDARTFWVKPSAKFLRQYLSENPVDIIVTTGPPHSVHLIGRTLQRKTGIPWVADFRDPWTGIEYYDDLKLTKRADAKHRRLEGSVVSEANAIVAVGPTWAKELGDLGAAKTLVATNGYDEDDFVAEAPPLDAQFTLAHLGTLAVDRDAPTLWKALQLLSDEIPGFVDDLKIELIGKTDPAVLESITNHGLGPNLMYIGYVSHADAVAKMRSAQVLLLLINNVASNAVGRLTGKIFEYLAAKRPIVCIGPAAGDPNDVLAETGGGAVCEFNDLEMTKQVIRKHYEAYKAGNLQVNSRHVEQFSRRNLTAKLSAFLDDVIETG